jgi:hypothetical protein
MVCLKEVVESMDPREGCMRGSGRNKNSGLRWDIHGRFKRDNIMQGRHIDIKMVWICVSLPKVKNIFKPM